MAQLELINSKIHQKRLREFSSQLMRKPLRLTTPEDIHLISDQRALEKVFYQERRVFDKLQHILLINQLHRVV